MSARRTVFLAVVAVLLISTAYAADPPARVARLNYISGQISIQPNGVNEWVAPAINRPLTSSDRVWADKDSRAELQLGGGSIRLNSETSLTLVNVADNNVQLQLDQGTMNLHIVELFPGEVYEVDTPNVGFTVRKAGDYRFDVDNAGDTTVVTAFQGEGDVTGDGPAVRVHKGEQLTFRNGRSLLYARTDAPGRDGFDDWCRARADREDRAVSARYVSRYTVGYEDLDDYGSWGTADAYGPIWYPRAVAVGWAPYRFGHWVWVAPWGWTWVDDAPWGFAPFHYGRWVYYRERWGWCPGPRMYRPYYAPALVGWIGGAHFGVSFGVGGGVGWFPLGWGEPYIPYYGHSRGYFQHVNITNTHITNITYITNNYYDHHREINNIHYVNRERPGAVTAVSTEVFRTSRPTRDSMVKVSPDQIRQASLERDVNVRPTPNSMLGVHAGEQHAVPPARVLNRPGRPDRGSAVTGLDAARGQRPGAATPERPSAAVRSSVAPAASETARTAREVPRPPNRMENNNAGQAEAAVGSRPNREAGGGNVVNNNRVPRPPDRQVSASNGGMNRGPRPGENSPRNTESGKTVSAPVARPERTVPHPPEGQPVRRDRIDSASNGRVNGATSGGRPSPNMDQPGSRPNDAHAARSSTPPVREDRPVTRVPEASRPARSAPPAHTEAPHQSPPAQEERKAEPQKSGGSASLRSYPSPYNSNGFNTTVRSASYKASAGSPPYSAYRGAPVYREGGFRSSTPASSPYSMHRSQPSYSSRVYSGARSSGYSTTTHSPRYSAASSRSSSHSYPVSRGSSSAGSHRAR